MQKILYIKTRLSNLNQNDSTVQTIKGGRWYLKCMFGVVNVIEMPVYHGHQRCKIEDVKACDLTLS